MEVKDAGFYYRRIDRTGWTDLALQHVLRDPVPSQRRSINTMEG